MRAVSTPGSRLSARRIQQGEWNGETHSFVLRSKSGSRRYHDGSSVTRLFLAFAAECLPSGGLFVSKTLVWPLTRPGSGIEMFCTAHPTGRVGR